MHRASAVTVLAFLIVGDTACSADVPRQAEAEGSAVEATSGRTAAVLEASQNDPAAPRDEGAMDVRDPQRTRIAEPRAEARAQDPADLTAEHERFAGVRLEVLALRPASSGTLTLEYELLNGSPDSLALDWGTFRWDFPNDVALVDLGTGERYTVMRDQARQPLASSAPIATRPIAPGERRKFWLRFQLPAEVERVSLSVPGFPLIDDVPVPR